MDNFMMNAEGLFEKIIVQAVRELTEQKEKVLIEIREALDIDFEPEKTRDSQNLFVKLLEWHITKIKTTLW